MTYSNLIHRVCPICASTDYEEVVTLRQENFTTSNPSYRLDRLDELGLDPEQLYPIVKCCQCEMVYSLYHLDDETEALVYNRIIDPDASLAKVLTVSRRIKDLKRWRGLLSLVNKSRPGRIDLKVIDYGCGWGTLLMVARGPGVQVVGFDVTEWKVAWARDQGLTICTSVKELEAYAPFDVGISTSVLEHMRSPRDAVAEMTSLLKPESYALITCIVSHVAQGSGWNEVRRRLSQGQPLPKEINPWEHLNYFTVETLPRLLSEFGLVPVTPQTQAAQLQGLFQSLKRLWKSVRIGSPSPEIPGYWQLRKP